MNILEFKQISFFEFFPSLIEITLIKKFYLTHF